MLNLSACGKYHGCHIGTESVTSPRDGSAWVRLVDIKRRVIQVHEYS